jgi:hypothetical protein
MGQQCSASTSCTVTDTTEVMNKDCQFCPHETQSQSNLSSIMAYNWVDGVCGITLYFRRLLTLKTASIALWSIKYLNLLLSFLINLINNRGFFSCENICGSDLLYLNTFLAAYINAIDKYYLKL